MKKYLSLLFIHIIIFSFAQSNEKNTESNDGKTYNTVVIGSQTWMTENLDVSRFRNGDPIPHAQSDRDWMLAGEEKKPAWCYVTIDEKEKDKIVTKYKKLYNSYAINDPRGIVPDGWRISTTEDWKKLDEYLISEKMEINDIVSREYWDKTKGTNKTGLNLQPGGWRDQGCGDVGFNTTFWCELNKDSFDPEEPSTRTVSISPDENGSFKFNFGETSWMMGHYVRCVKN